MNSSEMSSEITEQLPVNLREFMDASEKYTVAELPTDFDEVAIAAASKQLQETGILLMGEIHGVRENPDIYHTLMKQFECQGLALEWDESSKPPVEHYLQTGEIDSDPYIQTSSDGRVTAGHFALLRQLQREGMLKKLILFNPRPQPNAADQEKSAEIRDEGMATVLINQLDPSIPTLVVAGRIHANTQETNGDGSRLAKKPMGSHLKEHFPSLQPIQVNYLKGSFYNIEERQLETQDNTQDKASFTQDENGNFVYTLPDAHTAVVPKQ